MHMTVTMLDGGQSLITLEGRMDLDGVRSIDAAFSAETAADKRTLVVDLSQVSFLASVGTRALLNAARAQAALGGRLVLAAPGPMVRKVLEATGVTQIVPTYPDVAAARAGCSE